MRATFKIQIIIVLINLEEILLGLTAVKIQRNTQSKPAEWMEQSVRIYSHYLWKYMPPSKHTHINISFLVRLSQSRPNCLCCNIIASSKLLDFINYFQRKNELASLFIVQGQNIENSSD